MTKYQISSTKLQTNLKFQYSMTKTGLEFGNSVIVICLIFEIWNLEFLFWEKVASSKLVIIVKQNKYESYRSLSKETKP